MVAIAFIALVALGLRVWALDFGLPSWLHPDEFSFVFFPLNFYSGDFNPHFFTYPTLHYYLLALVYLACFAWENLAGAGYSFEQFLALHYFWDRTQLLGLARWVSALYGTATVVWVALLAQRVYGDRAGSMRPAAWGAGALLAVGVVHLRQSHLAGVDAAMTFYFVGAVWAAVRLLQRDRRGDYLLAGVLVGLAAACKYPGALAGVGVVAAHLVARRSLLTAHLWLAGLAAAGVFVMLSPYIILDFNSFATYFSAQVGQLDRGRGGDLGRGWWYHLHFSLVVNGGWVALVLLGLGVAETLRRRHAAGLVVLAAFLGYYAVMGSGQTVFTRYALPLMALQAVLVGGCLAQIKKKSVLALLLMLTLAQPLYASWSQVRLLRQDDTRVQARAWIEANVPAGSVLGNFGGWAGDVGLRNMEGLWWAVSHFERVFGREQLDRAVDFLAARVVSTPFYGYALQRTNMNQATGSMAEVERLETTWVVLHRHPLGYSQVDSSFARALAARADRVADFAPQGLWTAGAAYDVLDAFYLPLGGYGALDRPGPEIEIWKVRGYPLATKGGMEVAQIFARAYVAGAASGLGTKKLAEAAELAQRALALDGESADAWYSLAMARQLAGDLDEAERLYWRRLELDDSLGQGAAMYNLGAVYEGRQEWERAEIAYRGALDLAPWKYSLLRRVAGFYHRRGQAAKAVQLYEERQQLFADRAEFTAALGRLYEDGGRIEEAVAAYALAVQQDWAQPATYLRLANLYGQQQRYDLVVATSRALLARDPNQAEAHRLLAFILRHQGRGAEALEHARAYLRLEPEGASAVELARWLQDEDIQP